MGPPRSPSHKPMRKSSQGNRLGIGGDHMSDVKKIGIDLSKDCFVLFGVDERGKMINDALCFGEAT